MPIILFAAVVMIAIGVLTPAGAITSVIGVGVMVGMYHWTNIEDGYKELGFPWWKRPSALVLFVVVALIVAMLNP